MLHGSAAANTAQRSCNNFNSILILINIHLYGIRRTRTVFTRKRKETPKLAAALVV
jgi:hypothetical protein